ncbi:MAG: CPBP family glutamic-type intramembrane protease [Mariniblastus sp.]|nr:CPBP family glutamic-type intramembrane protease [Mariniblastus sp.]
MITNYLFIAALVLIALASLPLGGRALQRIRLRKSGSAADALLPPRPQVESPLGLVDVLVVFLFWAVSQGAALELTLSLMNLQPGDLQELDASQQVPLYAGMACGQLIATLFALAWITIRYRHPLQIFGVGPRFLLGDVRLAASAFVLIMPTLLLLQWLSSLLVQYQHGTIELLKDGNNLLATLLTWAVAVLLAPLAEEIFFRGMLQSWLQRMADARGTVSTGRAVMGGFSSGESASEGIAAAETVGPSLPPGNQSQAGWMPIILTSIAFGAVHFGQGLAPLILFLFSLVLGFLYRQTGSIRVCIVLHMLLNGYSMFWVTLDLFINGNASTP